MHVCFLQKDNIPFTNPAIVSLVVEFLFPLKGMPIDPKYLELFDPMPLPVIALACTAVSLLPPSDMCEGTDNSPTVA